MWYLNCRADDRALLSKPSISELVRVLGDVPYEQIVEVYRGTTRSSFRH
jgi:hypothetical protein